MTSRLPPQCLTCRHWISPLDRSDDGEERQTCAAFPAGIPDDIWWNQFDHRQPHEGDRGVRWEPADGAEFPEWAMAGAGDDDDLTDGDLTKAAHDLIDRLILLGKVAYAGRGTPAGRYRARHLHRYWTKGKGLPLWAGSPRPWTTLYGHLRRYIKDPDKAKRTAAKWFHEVFHFWPGSDLNRVLHGGKPRGERIGPG